MPSTEDRPAYWTFVPALPAPFLKMFVQQAEEGGFTGLFAPQVHGAPFATLGAAAMASESMQVASGIAIAAVRSPFETAMTAMDLDRISMGRFSLGLGASVHNWTGGFHGVPKRKPLTDLRETVAAIRYIVANAHKGLEPFEGEYYRADFVDFQPTPPPVREEIPIWIAAMQRKSVSLAGEVADGLMGHPMWSRHWAEDRVREELADALRASGRQRSDFTVHLWPWTLITDDLAQGIEDSRPSIGFYAGIDQYEPYFEEHGFGKEAKACQERIHEADLAGAAECVTEEMVRTFVLLGSAEEVQRRIEALWDIADALCPVPPAYGLPPDRLMTYSQRINEIVN